jgi:hypothetical protein
MSCPQCVSGDQVGFSTEMIVHHNGLKNLNNPGVLMVQKVLVCSRCGFSQFRVPKAELAVLVSDSPNGEQLTMAAAV